MSPITLGILAGTGGPTGLGWIGEYSASYQYLFDSSEIEVDSTGAILISSNLQIQKLSNAGIPVFSKNATISGSQIRHYKIARNSTNQIYSHGVNDTSSNAQFMQFDASGNTVFQRRFFSSIYQPSDIAVASSGNVYLFGSERPSGQTFRGLVQSINTSGSRNYLRHMTSPSVDAYVNAGGIDSSENAYFGGHIEGLGGVLIKLNSSGTVEWRRLITSVEIQGIAVTAAGVVYALGNRGAILKFNTSGTLQWQRNIGDGQFFDIKLDSSENIYAVGTISAGQEAARTRIVKWNSSGVIQWSRSLDSPVRDDAISIAVDNLGSFYLASMRFINNGDHRLLIAKFPDNGGLTGTYVVNGITYNYTIEGGDMAGSSTVSAATFSVSGLGGVGDLQDFTPSMTEITNTFAITPI